MLFNINISVFFLRFFIYVAFLSNPLKINDVNFCRSKLTYLFDLNFRQPMHKLVIFNNLYVYNDFINRIQFKFIVYKFPTTYELNVIKGFINSSTYNIFYKNSFFVNNVVFLKNF